VVALEILAPAFITWSDEEKTKEMSNGFFSINTFPDIFGVIDGIY
jgi:hypothetical protein